MSEIGFFTPVSYGSQNKTALQKCAERADLLLYFGNKKVEILAGVVVKNKQAVTLKPNSITYSKKEIVLKILTLPFLGIPALLFKAGYRLSHRFEITQAKPAENNSKKVDPAPILATEPNKSSNSPKQTDPLKTTEKGEVPNQPILENNEQTQPNPPVPAFDRVVESQKRLQTLLKEVTECAQPIIAGHGEYVVFHAQDGQPKGVSYETYEKVHHIFCEHLPHLTTRPLDAIIEDGSQRYQLLRAKVKEVDPSLELTFIPRTLYDLTYLEKAVEEDLEHKKICPRLDYLFKMNRIKILKAKGEMDAQEEADWHKQLNSSLKEAKCEKECWHTTYFFNSAGDSQNRSVQEIAHRLNNVIVAKLSHSNPLTYTNIRDMTAQSLDLFKKISPESTSQEYKVAKGIAKRHLDFSGAILGPTGSFSLRKEDVDLNQEPKVFSLAITENGDEKQIIQNCVAAECSQLAQNHFLLYRGGSLKKDKIHTKTNDPYSVSYGTSPFAGAVYDAGASSFHFMRLKFRDAFIVTIPFNQAENGLYYIPRAHSVCQLTAKGEYFHGRAKIPAGLEPERKIYGLYGVSHEKYKSVPEDIKSKLTETELEERFTQTYNQAISVK